MKKTATLLFGFFALTHSLLAQSPLNSLDFDGTNDYVSTTLPSVFNDIPNNDFTLEAWIKPNGNAFSRVIFAQLNGSNFTSLSLGTSNQIYFYVSNSVSGESSSTLPTGVWSHVACTWDASASQVNIYINGVLETISGGGSSSTGNDNIMTIGARTNAAQFFQGELDEVRIWDDIRTPCEISVAMNTEFTATQPNLVAYYNFNQGVAGGTNTGVTTLPDFTTSYNGTLLNFGLTGGSSNWITSGANITTVNQNSATVTGTDTRTECDSYTWIDGNTYTSNNNTATFNIVGGAQNGCDSLVTLDLTIINAATGTDTRTECNSYTWIDGNTYTASNNTATFNIVGGAANGCDSLVTLDLTINNVSDLTTSVSGVNISANNSLATYQWLDCDNNYAVISSETGQTFTPTSNGNYAVELTENGCVDTSACVNINSVGILENNFGAEVVVYPNPTHGNFSVDLGQKHESLVISITDIQGRLIQSTEYINAQFLNLNISEPSGIYIMTITSKDQRAVIRLVKE